MFENSNLSESKTRKKRKYNMIMLNILCRKRVIKFLQVNKIKIKNLKEVNDCIKYII